jgi:hypothetical protein
MVTSYSAIIVIIKVFDFISSEHYPNNMMTLGDSFLGRGKSSMVCDRKEDGQR